MIGIESSNNDELRLSPTPSSSTENITREGNSDPFLRALSKSPSSVSSMFDQLLPTNNNNSSSCLWKASPTEKEEGMIPVLSEYDESTISNSSDQEESDSKFESGVEAQMSQQEDFLDAEEREASFSQPMKLFSSLHRSLRHSWNEQRRTRAARTKSSILQQAREDSLRGWTTEQVASRRRSFAAVGEFGLTLFRPIDSVFFDIAHSDRDIAPDVLLKRKESLQSLDITIEQEQNPEEDPHQQSDMMDEDDDDFGPVQVAAEPTEDLLYSPFILSYAAMTELSNWGLPSTVVGKRWKRLYSVARDGDDFGTFLCNVRGYDATILVVRTDSDEIIGGFADAQWKRLRTGHDGSSYFGTGGSFLFQVEKKGWKHRLSCKNLERRTSTCSAPELDFEEDDDESCNHQINNDVKCMPRRSETHNDGDEEVPLSFSPRRRRLSLSNSSQPDVVTVHRWSGKNHYNQLCHTGMGKLALGGGGDGCSFGLCIQDNFTRGSSGPCDTYNTTAPLTRNGDHFEIIDFEVYGFEHCWD